MNHSIYLPFALTTSEALSKVVENHRKNAPKGKAVVVRIEITEHWPLYKPVKFIVVGYTNK